MTEVQCRTDRSTAQLVAVRLVHVGDQVWRVQRADTGKVLGLLTRTGQRGWRASASMRAFLGDGPAGADTLGDFVPPSLYAPLKHAEGHHYLPHVYSSKNTAVAGLQAYLDEQQAPAMGYGPHARVVRHGRAF